MFFYLPKFFCFFIILSLFNLSVIARQLVGEAIQCKYNALCCFLDCFVPRNDVRLKTSFPAVWRHAIPITNDEMRQFEMHPAETMIW